MALVVPLGWFWYDSLLPDTYDLAGMGYADWGGGQRSPHAHQDATPVAELIADPARQADVRTTLTAATDGDRYTVNGTTPGPVLRATEGDLVEVTLVNEDVDDGATLHWHGVDVPNAADGVAGVTQDAVMPGEKFVYRFVADQSGTFWYHSHQVSHEQVQRGLFGALVVEPTAGEPADLDEIAVVHRYDDGPTVNGRAGTSILAAEPGQQVRLRVVNTDNAITAAWVTGTPYQVLAIDGTEVHLPDDVEDAAIQVPAGARVDLGFVVPEAGARVDLGGTTALVFGSDPTTEPPRRPEELVDLLSYGEPTDPWLDGPPDRRFDYRIGKRPGFLDGRPGMWWTINGDLFPDVPMYMVREGDIAVMTIVNDSDESHPMHLHGHHALVLSRDGERATGSPWWIDSLEVGVGETYEVAFRADNPGIWMDHCHNLPHTREGLVAHLMYDGVSSSYLVGGDHGNQPE